MECGMRSIAVSTDVFARVWSLREPGEDNEDAILKRILGLELSSNPLPVAPPGQHSAGGLYDARYRATFHEGFEVFRIYRGTEYRARAVRGQWFIEGNDKAYGSLNELSRAIGARTENAWMNWFFVDGLGQRRPVSDLRDPDTILSRGKDVQAADETVPPETCQTDSDGTWRDDVRAALEGLRGKAHLRVIYQQVEAIRKNMGRSLPRSLEAVVRRTLEDHSSDSEAYRGGPDLFFMAEGKGAGVWALRGREHP
jgi:hypothetical protein